MQPLVSAWRKSSYSGVEHNCVEMRATYLRTWRRSSYSGANGDRVEVGGASPTMLVRDSKLPSGPNLRFTAEAWGAFLTLRPFAA